MTDSGDFRRWRQAVRRQVRLFVAEQRDAPPMVVWTSRNVRKPGEAVQVGAAQSRLDVAANIRAAVVDGDGTFAALGRRLHETTGEETQLSGSFGLVIAGEGRFEAWEVVIRAGELMAWVPATFDAANVGNLLLGGLRDAQRAREERRAAESQAASMRQAKLDATLGPLRDGRLKPAGR